MNLLNQYGESELTMTPIDFLGLTQSPWDYDRGARTKRQYLDNEGNVLITDTYSYVMDAENRNVVNMSRHLDWFTDEGDVIVSKDITKIMTAKALKALNREIRQGRIDVLEGQAEALRNVATLVESPAKEQYLAVADSIDKLFAHYAAAVQNYIARGTKELESSIIGEQNLEIMQILQIPTPVGLTVKQSIIYQITGEIV